MKRVACSLIIALSLCSGSFERMETGSRPQGMAGAFTAVASDAWAIHFNPAGLNGTRRLHALTSYQLLYGGLEGLHAATLSAAIPLSEKTGTIGVSIQDMGFSLNAERALTVSHGIALLKDLNFGYSLNGYNVAIKDLGQAFAFGLDLGLQARLYKRWSVGFFVHNLNMPQIGVETKSYLPRLLNFGVTFTPVAGITSALDVSKETGQPTRFAVGQEFQILEDLLVLRAGIQTEPVSLTFGLGTGMKNVHLDYALTTHSDLPLTHDLGVSVTF